MRKFVTRLLCVFAFGFGGTGAQAGLVQIDYTGSVQSLTTFGVPGSTLLTGNVAVGDTVSGRLRFSSNPAILFSGATSAAYNLALEFFELQVGAYTATASGGLVQVFNDDGTAKDSVVIQGTQGITGGSISGQAPNRLQFSLTSNDLADLASTALPTAADIAALWDSNVAAGNINFLVWNGGHTARYSLSSVTVRDVPVPEPGALSLLVLALAGLALMRRGRENVQPA